MKSKNRDNGDAFLPPQELLAGEIPKGVDRRAFLMRSASIGAAAVMTGCSVAEKTKEVGANPPPPAPAINLSPDLNVVKKSKGPVMTTLEEFYKVGPGPSSSHTIGPADQLAKVTALKVYLYGSLSATGKGHGTERAALAGIVGKEPATVEPAFLDSLATNPDQSFPVKLGDKAISVSLKDIIYDTPKGNFPHPNTMTCKLMGGDAVLLEQEYYSVGGGFIEWKGYQPPKKGQPKYPYSTMKELLAHADRDKLSIAQVVMANEVAVSGKSEAEINAFVDKITGAMVAIVKSGLSAPPQYASRPDQVKDKSRRSLQAHDGREVPERTGSWRLGSFRFGRLRRTVEAILSSPHRQEVPPGSFRRWFTRSARADGSYPKRKSGTECWQLRPSATLASTMLRFPRRRRLPGGNRCRFRDGSGSRCSGL
jgi:hypothetical protein